MAEEPWTYVQALKLKVHGIAPARFTNSPVTKIKGTLTRTLVGKAYRGQFMTDNRKPPAKRTMADFAAEHRATAKRGKPQPRWKRGLFGIGAGVVLAGGVFGLGIASSSLFLHAAKFWQAEAQSAPKRTYLAGWEIARTTDAMSDREAALVGRVAEGHSWDDPENIYLMISCAGERSGVAITWNKYLAGETLGDIKIKKVTIRIDDGEPDTESWVVSVDGLSTVKGGPHERFIASLRSASKLVARVEPYRSGPVTVTFSLARLTEALEQAGPQCASFAQAAASTGVTVASAAR